MTKNNVMSNPGTALKAGVWYTFSNFLSRSLVFITTPIFTRLLTKDDFGDYNNFIAWQGLFIILATLELYSTINRAKFDYEENIDQYISTIALTGSTFTIICYVFVIIFNKFFVSLLGMDIKYINIMFIYLLIAPALNIMQTKNRLYLKYKLATAITIISSLVSVILSLALVLVMNDKLLGRVVGQIVSMGVVNLCIYIYILYRGKMFKFEYCKYAISLALPLIPHLLSTNILGSSDRIMIKKFSGPESAALYSLAYNCALVASVLWSSMNQAMVPWLYNNLNQGDNNKIKKISRKYLMFFVCVAIGIMLFAPELVFILGGNSYADAVFIIPPVVVGCCFQFAYSMYVNVEFYYKKTFGISIGTMAAALANLSLNYIFINIYGYIAAAYTTLVCYLLLLLFHYLIVRRLKSTHIYDNKFNFIILGALIVIMLGINSLYYYNLLRRIILLIYVLCLVIILLIEMNNYKNS